LRLIARNLPDYSSGHGAADTAGALMLAALLIGNGTDFTGSGLASALGHTIGARCKVANGLVKAIVLPHTIRFNAEATEGRLGDAVQAFGGPVTGGAEALVDACGDLFAQLDLPTRLRDIGVAREDLAYIAREAPDDFFFFQNPRRVTEDELAALLDRCW
ncbi:MAG: iron-containing alcohol dehydrogenase, partial [Pontixanthobacter sp.]